MTVFGEHHHHCPNPMEGAPPWAVELMIIGALTLEKLERIMNSLDDTLAAVTSEDTKVDSIIALMTGIKSQLDAALSGTTLPPSVQAKVDAIFAQATASAGKIDTAIAANTPPVTPTP